MNKLELLGATALALTMVTPALAQDAVAPEASVQDSGAGAADQAATDFGDDIIVTAQRTSERLQDVPISVSAFSGEALERQQIDNSLDLQLSLPNVTYTKTNFTASSFTIRGIGDLCVGFSCDQATGIHINDVPTPATRLFETEYLDLERVEVLRGPQGTLFGRNATSGVVNFITARPDLSGFHASGQAEYGNYDSIKVQGIVNVPLGELFGVRLAGYYLKRDGYTHNLFDDSHIDDRELYQVRGSLRFEPSATTTIDLIGSYFREDDNRSRIQKQLCHRDPTGILGCLPDRLEFDTVNGNATFASILSSPQFLAIGVNPAFRPFAIRDLYGADAFSQFVQPRDLRTVNTNITPTYFSSEINAQARLEQEIGSSFDLVVTGGYSKARVDSKSGYFLNLPDSLTNNPGLGAFRSPANPLAPVFANGVAAIFDASGNLCVSDADLDYTGVFGGHVDGCSDRPLNYDRSRSTTEGYSVEAHVNSDLDGPFNFLLGAIYLNGKTTKGDYFVVQSEGSYIAALVGAAQSLNPALGLTPGSVYLAPAFFNSETNKYELKSYGLFGEAYVDLADTLKLTVGARYSNDKKFVRDRNPLLNFLVPYGTDNAFDSPFVGAADFDASTPGNQVYREGQVKFDEVTGRIVLDWKPTDDNLLYASYSRGYKSGGINPPFNPALFAAPETFKPEIINAFEIGSKNTLANGMLRLNASAFYYDYKDLQLSRILNRTSFNDNTDAEIYGLELEAIVRPDPAWLFNFSASYLHTKIKSFQLVDTRDPSGGRSDAVIIKDITNAANCVVVPTAGGAALSNGFVAAANAILGGSAGDPTLLRPPTAIPGTNTTGAYSICGTLAQLAANPAAFGPTAEAILRGALGIPTGPIPIQLTLNPQGVPIGLPDGVPVDLSGNELPNAPNIKFSAGAQYTLDFDNGMSLVTRGDVTYTGDYYSRSFNRPIDRIQGYEIVNVSVQLNGPDERWFVRGFVQNLTENDAITGQYVTDPSTGLFTNVFTLEPRRYGIAAGVKF